MGGEISGVGALAAAPVSLPLRRAQPIAHVSPATSSSAESGPNRAGIAPGPSDALRLPVEKAMDVSTINLRLAQLAARADQRGQEVDFKV